jgi:indolepyruvate ferredoxin oxidoreductase alpha subunit
MGNEAFAHAALEAGVGVVAGYPGTPSSELIETVARLYAAGAAHGVHVEWSTNEKAALEVAFGASLAGKRSLFTCKQVGLNVAADALMSANYVGTRGGLVLFVADDPGPISSQTEQDTRRFAAFAKVPVLDPATPEQGFAMMKAAFELSEAHGTPVIVRPTTRVNHASTFFDVATQTFALENVPPKNANAAHNAQVGFVHNAAKQVIFPARSYEAHGEINQRLADMAQTFSTDPEFAQFNSVQEFAQNAEGSEGCGAPAWCVAVTCQIPALGVLTGGVSTQYALEALDLLREICASNQAKLPPIRFMQVGTPYPFPAQAVADFAARLSHVLVLEELDHVLEDELQKLAGTCHLPLDVHGKLDGAAPSRGENSTENVAAAIAAFVDAYSPNASAAARVTPLVAQALAAQNPVAAQAAAELPARPPVLCAGCPHRGSFYAALQALKRIKVSRETAIFCGDIGCYTLGNAAPLGAVDTCLCMGGGITMAQGLAAADPAKKCLAFVGDSTFFASAMTGVANAVYNQHDITVFVLDNATTAMTGSQPHPGTGKTLMGGQSAPISIDAVCRALQVQKIVHANPLDQAQAQAAAADAISFAGPSVVIFESPCVWLQKPAAALAVDAQACTGCKKCVTEIGCPAVGFDPAAAGPKSAARGQAHIDASQCNGCTLCAQACPFDAISACKSNNFAAHQGAEGVTGAQPTPAAPAKGGERAHV